jgi:hypothetical protein
LAGYRLGIQRTPTAEAALEAVPGSRLVAVDLATQSATVIFDLVRLRVADLRIALGRTGYVPRAETFVRGSDTPRPH